MIDWGGTEAIEAVVAESFNNWVNDERISRFFADLSPDRAERLAGLLVDQICEEIGGPCTYAHVGFGLTDADFDALVEGMGAAMTTLGVPEAEQGELVTLLAPMRADIVEGMAEDAGEETAEEPAEEMAVEPAAEMAEEAEEVMAEESVVEPAGRASRRTR